MDLVERSRLTELETQIEKDKKAFYRIGMALVEIRDSRLYREEYGTFEEYCRDRWELSIRYANKLMLATKTMDSLQSTPIGVLPANEAQVRPLTKLETAEAQQEAWETVVETAPEGVITARHVSKVVNQIQTEGTIREVKKKETTMRDTVNKATLIDEPFKRAFDAFYWEVKRVRLEGWKTTSKEASTSMVKLIQDLIEVQ